MPAVFISTSDAPSLADAASISLKALPNLLSSTSPDLSSSIAGPASLSSQHSSIIARVMSALVSRSTQHTTSTQLAARFVSSSSPIVKRNVAIPLPLVLGIIAFILGLMGILLAASKAHYRYEQLDAERLTLNVGSPEPISNIDFRPNLLRRTTTSRLREDWQQWIAKPPPMRNRLRRRDSAILFGPGAGSRLSSEPSLSAHEVEASGVLQSDISDPPPAYTPIRV